MATHSSILAWRIPMDRGTWWIIAHGIHQAPLSMEFSREEYWRGVPIPGVKNIPPMQEIQKLWIGSLRWEDPLEEEMATHSSILAWRIPRTEEPGGL